MGAPSHVQSVIFKLNSNMYLAVPLSVEYRSAITNPATLGPGGCRIIHFSGLLID